MYILTISIIDYTLQTDNYWNKLIQLVLWVVKWRF